MFLLQSLTQCFNSSFSSVVLVVPVHIYELYLCDKATPSSQPREAVLPAMFIPSIVWGYMCISVQSIFVQHDSNGSMIIIFHLCRCAHSSITIHYLYSRQRISPLPSVLSNRTLIVLLEEQNLIPKTASTRLPSLLSFLPFTIPPPLPATHTQTNVARRQLPGSKRAFGWRSQIGVGWFSPILYLSQCCTSITQTPLTPPPHSSSLHSLSLNTHASLFLFLLTLPHF